jgi:small subunit ribosomal protein S1
MPDNLRRGDIVKGHIVKVTPEEVVVDVRLKSEGIIPLEEFQKPGEDLNLHVGQDIDVLIVRVEGKEGLPVLSHKKALEKQARIHLHEAYEQKEPVRCKIVEKTKGGFRVDMEGVSGFMPLSQSGVRRGDSSGLEDLIGKEVEAKVMELRSNRDPVFSRRAFIEEDLKKRKKATMEKLEEGALMKGLVKNITSYGAFIDLGGIDALLHVNDMAWRHVSSPKEVVSTGDELEVKVLKIEGDKISVGLKQKTPDPWLLAPNKYKEGAKVRGKITSLTKYGAFVEIEPGIEGLIHVSEMSWTKHVKHPSDMFKEGDSVLALVLQINPEEKRISLGYKQTLENPWEKAKEKYPAGTKINGEVTGLTDFGAFVQLEEGLEGLIHVSDMSWTQRIKHPKDIVQKGDIVEAVVREVNTDTRRISLSLKHIVDSPWDEAKKELRTGAVVEGTVRKLTDFGAFVEIKEGVEGLVHVSELSQKKVEHPSDVLQVGDKHKFKVLKFDPKKEKISLSLKARQEDEDRQELAKYMEEEPKSLASMGDIINAALKKKDNNE